MHQEIRQYLEDFLRSDDYLRGDDHLNGSRLPAEFHAHLGECAECASELRSLQAQSQLLRSIGTTASVEPRAGFYARVMERIEAQPASIWSVFLNPKFGFRLAVASAVLVALLGTYLVTSEPSGPEFASSPAVVLTDKVPAETPGALDASARQQDDALQQQQRDAVLVDLASYHQ
ncbi:MAG: anti-sigma factor family protein [Bryobacteraceae bacterium]